MHFLGGKSKTCNQIATYLNSIRQLDQTFWSPFVGAGWVEQKINIGPIYLSDSHPYLIALWRALQSGWVPPKIVTEAEYQEAKAGMYDDALTGFIGFGCSFSGKWWGGYAKPIPGKTTNEKYQRYSAESVVKKIHKMKSPQFFNADFFTEQPPDSNCIIYCDPPYHGTTGYNGAGEFDSTLFWAQVRKLDHLGHTVIVSEYEAPQDFGCVLEIYTKTGLRDKKNKPVARVEKLFRLGNHPKFQGTLW